MKKGDKVIGTMRDTVGNAIAEFPGVVQKVGKKIVEIGVQSTFGVITGRFPKSDVREDK